MAGVTVAAGLVSGLGSGFASRLALVGLIVLGLLGTVATLFAAGF
jgi:hypothetical protein